MMSWLGKNYQKCWRYFLNLIYPRHCLICQKDIAFSSPQGLCLTCFNKIQRNYFCSCPEVGSENKHHFKQVWIASPYQGIIKEAIWFLKYKGKLVLAEQLSQIMIEFARENISFTEVDCCLPVPLHRSRLREREFNQSQLLAEKVAKRFGLPLVNKALKRSRPTPSQTNLSKEERFKSLKDAFSLKQKEKIKGKTVLLIDDVFTTGATVNECAKVLIKGGAKEVSVFVLAGG